MVFMNFASKIFSLKQEIVDTNNLSGLCYKYAHGDLANYPLTLLSKFSGPIEKVAAYGYFSIKIDSEELNVALTQLNSIHFSQLISIYHLIGFSLQCKIASDHRYQGLLQQWFLNHSYRNQFLIGLIFTDYQQQFKDNISMVDNSELELQLLRSIVSKKELPGISFNEEEYRDDIITLLILEKYEERKRLFYEKDKNRLLDLVIFCASEIQSKHRVLNNNEDQFNGLIHSLLSKDFIAENQSQRGLSSTGKSYGELDLSIYTKEDNYPLGILEAFILTGIDRSVISKHLNKLTISYDPNGLTRNYVIIYAKSDDFHDLWNKYLEFVSGFSYKLDLEDVKVHDVSKNYPTFANIKIGIGNHLNGDTSVELYHIFVRIK